MSWIRCTHCGKRVKKNQRLKGPQCYCGSSVCQQARKNAWEQKRNEVCQPYHDRRSISKQKWRKKKPVYQYQRHYREEHPDYVKTNREKQRERNKRGSVREIYDKIVKTDALRSESLISGGFYALIPCHLEEVKKIVKTDALIVQLKDIQRDTGIIVTNSS